MRLISFLRAEKKKKINNRRPIDERTWIETMERVRRCSRLWIEIIARRSGNAINLRSTRVNVEYILKV